MARKIQLARAKHLLKDYREAQQRLLEVVQKNFGEGRSSGAEWRRWLRSPHGLLVPGNALTRQEPVSRQTLRAQLRQKYYKQAHIAGDRHRFPESAQPLPRRDRRALARAYAARDYAEVRSGKK